MEIYEKEYFRDDYAKQLEELRSRYHARTQNALAGRKSDKSPMPNATTVVYLHDDPDGGVRITTGDFVEYFNRRYGSKDRIGAARRSLEQAERRAELSTEADRSKREARMAMVYKPRSLSAVVRTANHRLSFVHAVFVLMMVLSLTMLLCTSLALKKTNDSISALESEIAVMEVSPDGTWLADYNAAPGASSDAYPAMDGGDSVEVYTPEEGSKSGLSLLFRALASLGK
ncbi:MAG: hypothetical protein IJA78_02885 [Clostridia bacterium]|nr:hypothetical protein [Clostridia bacterium]